MFRGDLPTLGDWFQELTHLSGPVLHGDNAEMTRDEVLEALQQVHPIDTSGYDDSSSPDDSSESDDSLALKLDIVPMTFSSDNAASRLPIEMWYYIIDLLYEEPETLLQCRLVCKAWYEKCVSRLDRPTGVIYSLEDADMLIRLTRTVPRFRDFVEFLTFMGKPSNWTNPVVELNWLGDAIAMLAGQDLPKLKRIEIKLAQIKAETLRPDFFTQLSTFTTITHLALLITELPSIAFFGRFVCSFQGLEDLDLQMIRLTSSDPPVPLRRRWNIPKKLENIALRVPDKRFMADASVALIQTTLTTSCNKFTISYGMLNADDYPHLNIVLRSIGPALRQLIIDMPIPEFPDFEPFSSTRFPSFSTNKNLDTVIFAFKLRTQDIPRLGVHTKFICDMLLHMSTKTFPSPCFRLEFQDPGAFLEYGVDTKEILKACNRIDDACTRSRRFRKLKNVIVEFVGFYFTVDEASTKELWDNFAPKAFPRTLERGLLKGIFNIWPDKEPLIIDTGDKPKSKIIRPTLPAKWKSK
ncbi:hypothetical protein WOLCODRAFT_161819 [Wolfiporia cocos MD-104 SS10]|uniref:F-box domain-containing protein n=1 Tax=Wolfiporia cocos (strain MD-104) TaxID=742152 RepID=A0A2H3JB16_WOLCO|nr:hypothetical protein WOLCODRAFT_161819 [Wolfiporia cocos MD-104 SS10]